MGWLEGQAALVTGGASGLGRAVVDRFVQEGARVVVLDRSAEHLEKLKADHDRRTVVAVKGDVTSPAANEKAVAAAVKAFGHLDVFVGNAGIWDYSIPLAHLPIDMLPEVFDEVFGVNVKGYILGTKAALPELVKTRGCIIYTLSNAAFDPAGGGAFYTASKHAVRGLVTQLAYELAPEFAMVYWRSLRHALPVEEWLAGAIVALSAGQTGVPDGLAARLGLLLELLRNKVPEPTVVLPTYS